MPSMTTDSISANSTEESSPIAPELTTVGRIRQDEGRAGVTAEPYDVPNLISYSHQFPYLPSGGGRRRPRQGVVALASGVDGSQTEAQPSALANTEPGQPTTRNALTSNIALQCYAISSTIKIDTVEATGRWERGSTAVKYRNRPTRVTPDPTPPDFLTSACTSIAPRCPQLWSEMSRVESCPPTPRPILSSFRGPVGSRGGRLDPRSAALISRALPAGQTRTAVADTRALLHLHRSSVVGSKSPIKLLQPSGAVASAPYLPPSRVYIADDSAA